MVSSGWDTHVVSFCNCCARLQAGSWRTYYYKTILRTGMCFVKKGVLRYFNFRFIVYRSWNADSRPFSLHQVSGSVSETTTLHHHFRTYRHRRGFTLLLLQLILWIYRYTLITRTLILLKFFLWYAVYVMMYVCAVSESPKVCYSSVFKLMSLLACLKLEVYRMHFWKVQVLLLNDKALYNFF